MISESLYLQQATKLLAWNFLRQKPILTYRQQKKMMTCQGENERESKYSKPLQYFICEMFRIILT